MAARTENQTLESYGYHRGDQERLAYSWITPNGFDLKGLFIVFYLSERYVVDPAGNYRIDDTDAKVIYKENRMRDFSPHLNASDMLAEFARSRGTEGCSVDTSGRIET